MGVWKGLGDFLVSYMPLALFFLQATVLQKSEHFLPLVARLAAIKGHC